MSVSPEVEAISSFRVLPGIEQSSSMKPLEASRALDVHGSLLHAPLLHGQSRRIGVPRAPYRSREGPSHSDGLEEAADGGARRLANP